MGDAARYRWHDFCLYHSRYLAKREGVQPSRLCFADKLVICLMPWWFYLPLANLSGEIYEYMEKQKTADSTHWNPVTGAPTWAAQREWYRRLQQYMQCWIREHVDGQVDMWTDGGRNQ